MHLYVTTLLHQLEQWIKIKLNKIVELSNSDKIFGRQNSEEIIEKMILSAKIAIFNNRKNRKYHHIKDVKSVLFKQLHIEEYHATLNLEEHNFMNVWEPVYDDLYDI